MDEKSKKTPGYHPKTLESARTAIHPRISEQNKSKLRWALERMIKMANESDDREFCGAVPDGDEYWMLGLVKSKRADFKDFAI